MPTKPMPSTVTISDDALRQRAYYLWEADGRPEGRSEHYWHLAVSEVAHMEAAPAPKAPRAKAKSAAEAQPVAVTKPATKRATKPRDTAEKPAKARRTAASA